MNVFAHWWNAEVDAERAKRAAWLPATIVAVLFVYIWTELLFLSPDERFLSLPEALSFDPADGWWPAVWVAALVVTFSVRMSVSVIGYFVAADEFDRGLFLRNLLVYAPAAGLHILIIVAGAAVVFALGTLASALGFGDTTNLYGVLIAWIDRSVPTLVHLPAMPWALLLAWTLYSFTSWFVHWLGHVSRLLWHVCHAPHHMPDFLHPLGAPLAFGFGFLVWIPRTLCTAMLAKLFTAEPLVFEAAVVALLGYSFEIFNHSSVHYDLVRRNRLLRFVTALFGGHGAYHYVHHSSAREHQMANLGGGVFLLWDRVFGTFVEPPRERPAIGLTGNPEIHLNALRVVFGGVARIAFELRANPSWRTRFLILFGPIDYMPPVTRDYVKKPPVAAVEAVVSDPEGMMPTAAFGRSA